PEGRDMAIDLTYRNRISRRRAVALGGTAAIGAFLAACRGGKSSSSSSGNTGALSGQAQLGGQGTAAAQATQESPYELVAKYSWRKLKWGGTPTRGGDIVHGGASANNWDLMKATTLTPAPPYYNGLYYFRLDEGSNLDGQTFAPDLAEKTEN